jgi:glycogen(starch) synthase
MTRRILMTADTVGGVWTYAVELARELGRERVELLLATMGRPLSAAQRADLASMGNVLVVESDYKLEWMDDPWADVDRAGQWLLELEREFRPDLIHLNGFAHGALPFEAPVLVVAHSCVASWWNAVHGCAPPSDRDEYIARVQRGLAAASYVVAPSAAMLRACERHYAFDAPRAAIHNGANGDSDPRPHHLKQPIVVTAGRVWDQAKNVAALVAAKPHFQWPLYIAGEGDAGSAEDVHVLGLLSREGARALFDRAAIFAEPAFYEPFGLSALEAALAGCALVLGDIESLREVWGDAAVYVDPRDPAAIGAAIAELAQDPIARAELAERARIRAKRYTTRRFGAAYLALYKQLIDERHAAFGIAPQAAPRDLQSINEGAQSLS